MTKKAVIVNCALRHASGKSFAGVLPSPKIIQKILTFAGIRSGFLNIIFVSDPQIRKLNRAFLGRDRSTDVLAFDYAPGSSRASIAGDAYVSLDTARRVSKELGISLKDEIMRYAIHAILHLTGHDDLSPSKKKVMWKRQEALVRKMTGFKVSTSQRF